MKTPVHRMLKKLLSMACICLLTHALHAQIPNWDFENWSSHTNDVPLSWTTFGITTKVTPGVSGQYAIKLQAGDQSGPGAALHGMPGNHDEFYGGVPFTDRPDSMVAYFKYDITAGDSAWVLIIFRQNGVNISNDLYLLSGTHTSDFERMAFKIHYLSGATPDSVIVGFTSTIPDGGSMNLNSYVILDDISFTGTTQNVPNPDFESWTTQVTYTPDGWQSNFRPAGSAVDRSANAYAGSYALKLQSVFGNQGDTIDGYTQTRGPHDINGDWGPAFAVNSRPTSLKGFYTFTPQNGDTFRIMINLFKDGINVGYGEFMSDTAKSTYTPFSAPINYFGLPSGNPDSALISIATYSMGYDGSRPRGESVALIDNLSFDDFIHTGISDVSASGNNISLYPNPAEQTVHIHLEKQQEKLLSVSILTMQGQQLAVFPVQEGNNEPDIDVSALAKGTYIIRLQTAHNNLHTPLIIVR